MSDNIQEWRQAEKLPEALSHRRTRLGRGLGALLLRRNLARAGALAPLLREPALPRGMPAWARAWAQKVWRLGRKT